MSISISMTYRTATITVAAYSPAELAERFPAGIAAAKDIIDTSTPEPATSSIGSTCSACGGAIQYAEWTRKSDGREFRAFRCINSKSGEQHDIEWVNQ